MRAYQLIIVWRVLLERLLDFVGLLNLLGGLRASRGRKRIAFQAYGVHLAQFFEPVIAWLQQERPEIEIHFIILPHPHFAVGSLWAVRDFARDRLKIPISNVHYFWQVLWQKYDLLVCTDVYARFPLRPTKKVLLKHGAGVASRILKRHPFRKTIFDFDLVLVNGDADYDLLRKFCPAEFISEKVAAAGFPYLDRLKICAESRDAYLRRIGLASPQRVALVAPSWRGLQSIQAFRPGYFDEIITVLSELDWQIIIKLHACSFNKAMAQGEDWEKKLCRYARPGIAVDEDIDDVPALLHADLLITDISSRAFNFMLLDKPVIAALPDDVFTDGFDEKRINLLKRGALLARSAAEIKSMIQGGLRESDELRAARRTLAQLFFANHGRATEVVADRLLRQING